jgi:tetratricopeptide (TPR) repeat protein
LWLGAAQPAPSLVAHLESEGFVLVQRTSGDTPAHLPLRRLTTFDPFVGGTPGRVTLGGRRIALIQPDPASADMLAQALRAKGAEVIVLSFTFDSFERAEQLDPDIVLIEPSYFCGEGWQLMNALWQHPRLCWGTVLLASPEAFGFKGPLVPDMRPLCAAIQRLCSDCDQLRALSRAGEAFEVDLHTLGPARTLRLLVSTGRPLRAEVSGPHVTITVDAAKELIVGARAELHAGGPKLFGPSALAMCLSLERGHVSVRPVQHPSVANVMAPFEEALHAASEALMAEHAGDTPTRPALFEDTPTRQWEESPFSHPLLRERAHKPVPPPAHVEELLSEPQSTEPFAAINPHSSPLDARAATSLGTLPFRAHGLAWHALLRTGSVLGALLLLSWIVLRAHEPGARQAKGLDARVEQTVSEKPEVVHEPNAQRPAAAAPAAAAPEPMEPNSPTAEAKEAEAEPAPKTEAEDEEARAVETEDEQAASAEPSGAEHEPEKNAARQRAQRAAELARMGHTLRVRGMYTEARGKYLAALETLPHYPRALAGLAQLALLRGDGEEASQYAEELVAERPGQAVYHLILGDAYRAAGQLTKARAAWRVAADLGSAKARSRLNGRRAVKAP